MDRHESNRAYWRACRTPHLEWQADEGKFVAPVPGQLLQVEIFDDVDAVTDEQNEMTWKAHLEVWINDTDLIPGDVVCTYRPDAQAGQDDASAFMPPARM